MAKSKVKNKKPAVENQEPLQLDQSLVEITKNLTVVEATQNIFEDMVALENMKNLSEDISKEIATELMHGTFMTEQLELTDKQKERLKPAINSIVEKAKNAYLYNIKSDDRLKKVVGVVRENLTKITEELLSGIAKEVNRGALINCTAVLADVKNDKYNKIELQALKTAGDVTIPTRGLFIATNCIDLIKGSIDAQLDHELKAETEAADKK